jgi:hypothetical protein
MDSRQRILIEPGTTGISIHFILKFDHPIQDDCNILEVRIGRSVAQAQLIARPFFDQNGQTFLGLIAPSDVRTIAKLWHATHIAHEEDVPVSFLKIEDEKIAHEIILEGYITSINLKETLIDIEQNFNLGVKTTSLNPPIYLEDLWGRGDYGRPYGKLDAMIARLHHFNIVPDQLIDKANDLKAQNNWAVIYPRNLPNYERILEALDPLIQHRGGRIFELAEGHNPQVINNFLADLAQTPIESRPYYLLALGDLDVLSIEYQYFLQSFGALGRLAFDNIDDYRKYAEKVLYYENILDNSKPPAPTYIATDYDDICRTNYDEIVVPLATEPDLPRAQQILSRGRADKERVLTVLKELPPHSPLMIFAHGFEHSTLQGYSPEAIFEDMQQFQGSPILDDFELPRVLGSTMGLLCGEETSDTPIAQGGIIILHACYSAGTINRETMPEWIHLQMPARVPPKKPFISNLTKCLLANPQGPLAIYGHVNRSHQANYYDPAVEDKSYPYRHYSEMLKTLIKGLPIGLGRESCRQMTISYMDQVMTLSYQIEWLLTGQSRGGYGVGSPHKGVSAYESSFLQYSFGTCNFRNYIILGDPMSRIAHSTLEK